MYIVRVMLRLSHSPGTSGLFAIRGKVWAGDLKFELVFEDGFEIVNIVEIVY